MPVTFKQIKQRVNRHDNATKNRRDLMEDDYDLWRLEWKDGRDEAQADDYETYTTNEPKTYFNKMVAIISSAVMTIRIPQSAKPKAEREIDNTKEQFIRGAFRSGDDWLKKRGMPEFIDQVASLAALRGFSCGRAMFVKGKDRRVRFELMPWDPLSTFWEMGPNGLRWICNRTMRSRAEIFAQYGDKTPEDLKPDEESASEGQPVERFEVYDYYDTTDNAVGVDFKEGMWLKAPKKHGMKDRVPGWVVPVGAVPPIRTDEQHDDTDKDFGLGLYDAVRQTYNDFNETMSDAKTLVRRAVKGGYTLGSAGGRKGLEGNPAAEGTIVQLDSTQNESLKPIEREEMPAETGVFLANVSGEMQRGSLPHSLFGDQNFTLSGFAIQTLREGSKSAVDPFIKCLTTTAGEVADLAIVQYGSGDFAPITLRGRQYNGEWFERQFAPSDIEGTDCPIIEFEPQLPKDDPARFAMAQIARSPDAHGFPILPDREIWEGILGLEDTDAIQTALNEQFAVRSNPIASNLSLMLAAARLGRTDLAFLHELEMMKLIGERYGIQQQQPPQPQVPGILPQGAPGIPVQDPTFAPNVLPQAALGGPPPAPFPQAGPLVPPGQPRPGAALDEATLMQRLAAIGLVPPM